MSTTTATVGSLPETGVWSIDTVHSTVDFSVSHHVVATFRSSFTNITGSFNGDRGALAGEVQASEITLTGLDRLKSHILTPDFFNAEEFPTFAFRSSSIEQRGSELTVKGELTLRGVTRPIIAAGLVRGPQAVRHGDGRVTERLGIDLSTTIDRRDFGIDFNREAAEGLYNIGWDVQVQAALELYLEAD